MQFKNKISSIIDRNMIMLNDVQKTFQQQISYLINKKENELNNLKNQYNLNNPEKKEKKGFVEISKNGKRVLLNELKKGDIIKLNDTKIQRSAIIS
jgi:exodeoxyribonuclease VII large subunit